jgi:flagellar hook assembly protein FlgD
MRGLALRQNGPNPFGTSTLIAFDLPEATGARIKVYDTHGRIIKTLTNKNYKGGRHVVTWLGDDEAGNRVGSGVYFIRMEAREFEDMKKVMLLR